MDRSRWGRRSSRAIVLNAVVLFRIRLASGIGSSLIAVVVVGVVGGSRLSLIVRLGKSLRVKIDVGLSGHGSSGGCSSCRLFRVRRAASLAVAASVRDRRCRTERHRIGLLNQMAQAVEIG